MLRVTRTHTNGSIESLRVEGRLTRFDLPRFEETCAEALDGGRRLRLDVSGLLFADREAVATLKALRRRGVAFVGASGFLDALLAEPPR
jgi:ABC-type transporter Mla MlaB component